jgi:Protein of unknown function (DUF998)
MALSRPSSEGRHAYDRLMGGRQVRTAAWVGLSAQVLLVVIWIAAGFWQGPGYSVQSDSISDLTAVTAPGGLFVALVIALCGLGTILFAWLAVWPSLRGAGARAAIGAGLLGVSILGLHDLLAPFSRVACRIADEGCSPKDQLANFGGQLDLILSIPGIFLFILAVFVLSGAMSLTAEFRDLARPARRIGVAFVLLLFATALGSPLVGFGLMNRVLAISAAAMIAGLAWQIARRASPP